ncbi:DEAD/DEAH box helicase [Methylosinus sp. PW1]|uniref:DEAD/DEAH box helicase n=1 Tax=Methylosinus sp. PW1 TaxID=107636 RepID=UPI00056B590D|nr:DEAD/DEAH box helicase [Methylosinus sp. PW1]
MFDFQFDKTGVHLTLKRPREGLLSRLLSHEKKRDLTRLPPADRELLIAVADLRALAGDTPDELNISADHIRLSHRLAAGLSGEAAHILGLPQIVDLTLKTDAEGLVGTPNFRLKAEWFRHGQRQAPRRIGSILETSDGPRRLPLWLLDALDVAESFPPGGGDVDHWGALARFRQALDPGVRVGDASHAAKVSMTDFLSGLQVRMADRLSIASNGVGDDFDVLPFSSRRINDAGDDAVVSESDSELDGPDLGVFQRRVRERGGLPAYRLRPGSFLVIDRSALPALDVMAEMQRAPKAEREAFIRNPRPRITEAVEAALRRDGKLDNLSPEAEEEAIEAAAGPLFVETREFSERVTGIALFQKPTIDGFKNSETTWMPEEFARRVAEALDDLPTERLEGLRDEVRAAIERGQEAVFLDDVPLPARPETLTTIDAHLDRKRQTQDQTDDKPLQDKGPYVLDGKKNFEQLEWFSKLDPRHPLIPASPPTSIRTPLKQHQIESFEWQVDAWRAGLPGILNADEQGLGKTLQTIAFLVWLKSHMAQQGAEQRGPVLIIAPTSLLENWEQEVARHVEEPGLGHLIRLYGSAISSRKIAGKAGRDIDSGETKLDLGFLTEAIEEGRAHRFWLLTTYTTLTNYQHSLGRIRFSALVFDEIQTLKNPTSLRAQAALFMKADFRIGLTGTPIENSAVDLWAVMEQLSSGALGTLAEFRGRYGTPDGENMNELHARVFKSAGEHPALAIRRIKNLVASDLPKKTRRLHPRLMPEDQVIAYDDARLKLAQGGLGAALKALHHIRSVSVHPGLHVQASASDFVSASARLAATFDILAAIARKGERVLVFIEHREMQYRFIELARAEFGLDRIDLINGDTPIRQRQAIVNRFQRHLEQDQGFDILVLGPKAAGVGLTLTAATHVIHLSRWWNPAVEEQCNDRVHRLGQTRPISIHLPMAIHPGYRENTFDCLLQSLMQRKRKLAESALWPAGDSETDVAELRQMLHGEKSDDVQNAVRSAIERLFLRDEMPPPVEESDGSILLPET